MCCFCCIVRLFSLHSMQYHYVDLHSKSADMLYRIASSNSSNMRHIANVIISIRYVCIYEHVCMYVYIYVAANGDRFAAAADGADGDGADGADGDGQEANNVCQ